MYSETSPSHQDQSPSSPLSSPLTEEAFQRANFLKQQKSIPSDEQSAEIAKQQDIKRRFLLYLESLRSSPTSPQHSVSRKDSSSDGTAGTEETLQLQPQPKHDDGIVQEEKNGSSLIGMRKSSPLSLFEPQIEKRAPKVNLKKQKKKRKGKKSQQKTYCLCKQPDGNKFMIRCDGPCKNWYHPVCLGLKESLIMMEFENHPEKKFLCWECQDI